MSAVDAQNPCRYIESVQFDSEPLNRHHSYVKVDASRNEEIRDTVIGLDRH